MKIEWNRKYTTISVYAFIVLTSVAAAYLVMSNIKALLLFLDGVLKPILPIVYGFAVAYLINPIMVRSEKLLNRMGWYKKLGAKRRRGISLLATYLIVIAVLVIFSLIVLPHVVNNITTMYGQLQSYVIAVEGYVNRILTAIPPDLISQDIVDQLSAFAGSSVQKLINWMANSAPRLLELALQLGNGIITGFIAVMVSIYLLFAKERFIAQLKKMMCAFFSLKKVERMTHIAQTTHKMFGGFITGKIIDSTIIGILCFIGLSVMKMPNAVLVSFIVGVTNVLPYFGPFIGAVPGFLLIAIISPVQGLVFLLFILVLQQIDGNIIGPMVLGDSIGLSAFWVVFAILFFGGIFGILGMFIGVPTFGVIYTLIREAITIRLEEKNLSSKTEDYIKPAEDN